MAVTKTKTSVGKETVSQTVARAKAMLGSNYDSKTKAPSTKRVDEIANQKFVSSDVRNAYNNSKSTVITPERVAPTEVADIPSYVPPNTTDFGSILDVGNAGLVDGNAGLSQQSGQFVYDPSKSAAVNAAEEANLGSQGTLAAIAQYLKPTANENENAYKASEKEVGLTKYQNEVGARSSELNAIVANRDANLLRVEGQGRGIPEVIIGGQQAQINKEAAIQALPVQAQLAAAQGNLEMAQSRLDTLFKVRSADIAANNTYKTNLANAVMQYADKAQQNILNAKLADISAASAKEQQNLSMAQEWAKMAVSTGQSGLISSFTSLDPKSPTFTKDFGALQAKVVDPMVKLQQEAQRASIANIYDQINARQVAAREAQVVASTQQEATQAKMVADSEQALSIKKLASEIKGLSGLNAAVGAGFKKTLGNSIWGISPNAIAGTDRADFEAQATRLANLLTLDNLDLMSGVLSETDIKILETAGSNLRNFDQSEASYKKEVDRIISTMDRTISKNGVTPEQAVFFGLIDEQDALSLDAIWNNI